MKILLPRAIALFSYHLSNSESAREFEAPIIPLGCDGLRLFPHLMHFALGALTYRLQGLA